MRIRNVLIISAVVCLLLGLASAAVAQQATDSLTRVPKWQLRAKVNFMAGRTTPLSQGEQSNTTVELAVAYRLGSAWYVGVGSGMSDLMHLTVPVGVVAGWELRRPYGLWWELELEHHFASRFDNIDQEWQRVEHQGGWAWGWAMGLRKAVAGNNTVYLGLGYRYFELHDITYQDQWAGSFTRHDYYQMHRYLLCFAWAF